MSRRLSQQFACQPLAELTHQLLLAPSPKRVEQVRRAERLHDEIDVDRNYPLHFVTFRITGYRSESDDATLVGAALRADLRLLIDMLSRSVGMPRSAHEPLLSPAEPDTASPSATVTDTTSALPRVCAGLLQAWEDSLYAADLRRLQQAWAGGEEMEIRLVRSMDRFTGYAVVGDDPPARFWLPAARVAAILGPHLLLGDEP